MSDSKYDPFDVLRKYEEKKSNPEAAIKEFIKPGDRIFIDSGCSEPISLTKKLVELAPKLTDVEVIHLLSLSDIDYYAGATEIEALFRFNAFFIGRALRNYVNEGMADYTPILLSEIPKIFKSGQIHLDTALIQVSPPNKKGMCSLGINVDIAKAMAESADNVIAEINPNMPKTFGNSEISLEDIDAFVTTDHDIIEYKYSPLNDTEKRIGAFVASLIEDGSTIQVDIGHTANAVLAALEGKKDLGVHSVVITDPIVDLVEKGVITGIKKTLNRDKIVSSFALGTRRLYNFMNNNQDVELYGVDYTCDPNIIGKNIKQIAVNGALSVDITGQVNADSMGHRFFSGLGALIEFTSGAARSRDGKPIIVLPSTATLPDGKVVSRILPCLSQCSGVAINRGMAHYVVTEWGIAYLYAKNIRERVLQMINIAHPDFREELLEHAKNCNYVYHDQVLPTSIDGRTSIYPTQYETKITLKNGKSILVRPVKPSDERLIQELYYSLDKEEVFLRFFSHKRDFRHTMVQPLVVIDYNTNMILVCVYTESGKEEIVATGGFFKTENPAAVEMAYIVRKDWRGNDISKILLNDLVIIARELKYKRFSAEVMRENTPMIRVITNSGYNIVEKIIEEETIKFVLNIQK